MAGILRTCRRVTDVVRERYSERQRSSRESEGKGHRADILFKRDGRIESVDVTIANTVGAEGRVRQAWRMKKYQYGGEAKVNLVVCDTAGNMSEEGWRFLEGVGATLRDMRTIQRIIAECGAKKLRAAMDRKKNRREGF